MCESVVAMMDDDRRVAWMRYTYSCKLVVRGYSNLRVAQFTNALTIYARREFVDDARYKIMFNAVCRGMWVVHNYTHNLGLVMSRLVDVIALHQRPTQRLT